MLNAVVLGTFDGIHSGHRAVIDAATGYNRIAVTFKKPPKAYFDSKQELLMTPEDKYKALLCYGVNEVYMPDFSEIKDLAPTDFLIFLRDKYNPKAICCGFNYRFGKNAEGDTESIGRFCRENGIKFMLVNAVSHKGEPISSSKIRTMIAEGNLEEANSLIFGGFGFSAEVVHGDGRGGGLGFPTVNQIYPECLVKPKFGVYLSKVCFDGREFKAITNIGYRPTFRTEFVTAETHISHFEGDLYGKTLSVKLLKFIRAERKFDSAEELKRAVINDICLICE